MKENEAKDFLKQHGDIYYYDDISNNDIKAILEAPERKERIPSRTIRQIFLIKESQLEEFAKYVHNYYSPIQLPFYKAFEILGATLEEKHKDYLNVKLCVDANEHLVDMIPDIIPNKDTVLFYKSKSTSKSLGHLFLVVTDKYANQVIQRFDTKQHAIFGIIDFAKGNNLLQDVELQKNLITFLKEVSLLGKKYPDIQFITISDSILIKNSFNIMESGQWQLGQLLDSFSDIVTIFKDIRKAGKKILNMSCYGVFSYGVNRCASLDSGLKNVFHSGILSDQFKTVIEIESNCKNSSKEDQYDMYLTRDLYRGINKCAADDPEKFRKKYLFSESSKVSFSEDVIGVIVPD